MDYLIELIGGLILVVLSGLGWQISNMKNDIKELQTNKADHDTLNEIKDDLKLIIKELTELKVEQAKWQARRETIEQMRLEKSSKTTSLSLPNT
jgi:hypothetical protein